MAFLKLFRKKGRKEHFEDLDLPPAPPPLEKFDEDLNFPEPDFPEPEFGKEPKLRGKPEPVLPKFPEFEEMDMPELPEFPSLPAEPKPSPKPLQPKPPKPGIFPKPALKPVERQEGNIESHVFREHLNYVYLKLNDLKSILADSKVMGRILRESQSNFHSFESMAQRDDKAYDKLNRIGHDIQKILIYTDKNLFRGDKI